MKHNTPKISIVDAGLRDPVKLLLSFRPEDRLDEHEFLKVRYLFLIEAGVNYFNYFIFTD